MAKAKPGHTNVTVTLPERIATELRVLAAARRWTQGDIVAAALEIYLRRPHSPALPPATPESP